MHNGLLVRITGDLPILAIVVGGHRGLFFRQTPFLSVPDVFEGGVESIVGRVSVCTRHASDAPPAPAHSPPAEGVTITIPLIPRAPYRRYPDHCRAHHRAAGRRHHLAGQDFSADPGSVIWSWSPELLS